MLIKFVLIISKSEKIMEQILMMRCTSLLMLLIGISIKRKN